MKAVLINPDGSYNIQLKIKDNKLYGIWEGVEREIEIDRCDITIVEDKEFSRHKHICDICGIEGIYDSDDDLQGSMTLLCHMFEYVHWGDCYDKAMEIRGD